LVFLTFVLKWNLTNQLAVINHFTITVMTKGELIKKYNMPGPRYTSYPTVPHWKNNPSQKEWEQEIKKTFQLSNTAEGISIYIHLPYCESQCTFCGCNMRVSRNHKVELPYIQTVLTEWKLYLAAFDEKPIIKEIHLGGGTPTYFSPENLTALMNGICENAVIAEGHEFSFEGHPKSTSREHLQTLYDLGFERISLGIQDFDPKVQEIINRIQPFDMVKEVVKNAREIGYKSVNFDLIYGLPLQTMDSVIGTIELTKKLRPDRIAFYSYAHVPWEAGSQRKFTESDLPKDSEKRALYDKGKAMFFEMNYSEVGMDHFALPGDPLFKAIDNNTLHRNFMGYTANSTQLMIGLGVSAISDSWECFAQNSKNIGEYKSLVEEGIFPIVKGHILTPTEVNSRQHILNLMCHFYTEWNKGEFLETMIQKALPKLEIMEAEGILKLILGPDENSLEVTELGKIFVRNICMLLDPKLDGQVKEKMFSKTI
jgi:oxygen-independent coproporphyrinogen-3 oxidase